MRTSSIQTDKKNTHTYLCVLSWCLGATLWFSAIGIHLGPIILQPTDLVILAGYPLILLCYARFGPRFLVFIIVYVLCLLLALVNPAHGDRLTISYYVVFLLPLMILLYITLRDQHGGWRFIQGFAAGGVLMMPLGLIQFVFGPETLDIRSNTNFSILHQPNRAFGLAAESALFASPLCLLIGMLVTMSRLNISQVFHLYLFRSLGNTTVLAVLALVTLVLTLSSTIFSLLPVIFVLVLIQTMQMRPEYIVLYLIAALLGYLFVIYVFLPLWGTLRGGAQNSIYLRYTSMVASILALQNEQAILGFGMGNNHLATPYLQLAADLLNRDDWGDFFFNQQEGINSALLTKVFEEGIVGISQILLSLWFLCSAYLHLSKTDAFSRIMLTTATASLIIAFLVNGYRGSYISWFWMVVPLALLEREKQPVQRTFKTPLPRTPLRLRSIMVPPIAKIPGPGLAMESRS